jgi:predicted O-methyltransferase YrrM
VERFCSRPEQFVEIALASPFSPIQVFDEIRGLLELLAERRPKSLLEIGSSRGGSLYLFTKVVDPAATLVSVDLRFPNPGLLRSFAQGTQKVTPLQGDSGAPETIAEVKRIFPSPIDFLFIDGDHSYEGVKRDFETYSPMVRPGGLIAFHDIVDDNETRYGVITGGWAGGVPKFWNEVKTRFEHRELVKNPAQDACGIGLLFVKG